MTTRYVIVLAHKTKGHTQVYRQNADTAVDAIKLTWDEARRYGKDSLTHEVVSLTKINVPTMESPPPETLPVGNYTQSGQTTVIVSFRVDLHGQLCIDDVMINDEGVDWSNDVYNSLGARVPAESAARLIQALDTVEWPTWRFE